jgi:hypothetical protein
MEVSVRGSFALSEDGAQSGAAPELTLRYRAGGAALFASLWWLLSHIPDLPSESDELMIADPHIGSTILFSLPRCDNAEPRSASSYRKTRVGVYRSHCTQVDATNPGSPRNGLCFLGWNQQGAATLHPSQTGHRNSGLAVKGGRFCDRVLREKLRATFHFPITSIATVIVLGGMHWLLSQAW